MSYYKQTQIIAACDKNGNILGPIEKWEAHKKGILHRAFTVALLFEDHFIVQHRKHPAFDGVYDVTSSSHQLFENGKIQDTVEAIYLTLEREWNLKPTDIAVKPRNEGFVYYKAKDEKSEFIEHEVCDIYTVKVEKIPIPVYTYAYGLSLISKEDLKNTNSRLYSLLAPWIISAIEEIKL